MEFSDQFNNVLTQLKSAENLEDSLWTLQSDIVEAMNIERFTIYRKDSSGDEIVSWYRSSNDGGGEIRLYMAPSSLAGYVATTSQALMVDDAYDSEYLASIQPDLRFDDTYDRQSGYMTEAMITVPITHKNRLYGVLQIVNNADGGPFSDDTYYESVEIAKTIAENFRYELKTEQGPFDQLVHEAKISLDDLEEIEEFAKKNNRPTSYYIKTKVSDMEAIGSALSSYYQIPFHEHDPILEIEPSLIENFNTGFLASNYWVPLSNDGDRAVILIADPHNEELILEIQNVITAIYYDFQVALADDILRYLGIEDNDKKKMEAFGQLGDLLDGGDDGLREEGAGADEDSDILSDDEDSKIITLVNKIIVRAKMDGASDIHIEPHKYPRAGEVRFRIDGVCRKVFDIPSNLMRPVLSRVKILANLDIAERRKPQDGKMSLKFQGATLELRVATCPVVNGEQVVMRILAAGQALPFEKLMLSTKAEKRILEYIKHPHGIVLVVGPTGSGKTTTLHAILALLNNEERKILTAEDPVEITQAGLQQVQIQRQKGLNFAAALRSFLRLDPDVILIGEMRDKETAESGIEASLTGHLVFSTLHTNSAPETVTRLLEIGLDPLNFADALIGILAQRLVRTLCGNCKEAYKPDQEEIDRLIQGYDGNFDGEELGFDMDNIELFRPKEGGCDKCTGSGYRGRVGIHEALLGSPEMKRFVSRAATVSEIRDLAIKEGMVTLNQDGIEKVFKGVIDLAQLRRVQHG